MFYVYILYSAGHNRYYVGFCSDIESRLKRHNGKMVQSTKGYVPWELKYTEVFSDKAAAMRREKEIKGKKSSVYLRMLIERGGK